MGFTAILHTWGQNLLFHPHLHCVVTGGGLAPDGSRWLATRPDYFLPVKVLGRLFRGKFLAALKSAYHSSQLHLEGSVAYLADPQAFSRWLGTLYRQNWVIYAKLLAVDGRRTSEFPLEGLCRRPAHESDVLDGGGVPTTLSSPRPAPRFVRIRHFGMLTGRNVYTKLARCRQLLGAAAPSLPAAVPKTWSDWVIEWTDQDPFCCPRCHGPLIRLGLDPVLASPVVGVSPLAKVDSS